MAGGGVQNRPQTVPPGIKLKIGDSFQVIVDGFSEYTRSYSILPDGTVLGYGFDRFVADGLTVDQIKAHVTKGLVKIIKDPHITVLIDSIRPLFVYVTSVTGQVIGPLTYVPDMTLRQVAALVVVPDRKEDYEVRVFREGKLIVKVPFIDVINGSSADGALEMKPQDVVSVLDRPVIRVWATGAVKQPAMYRVVEGTTAQQLLVQSGGVKENLENTNFYTVKLRRGPQMMDVDVSSTAKGLPLEPGDTLFVDTPKTLQITIGGEIVTAGERRVREGTNLMQVIESSGGISGGGSYENVLVFRKGETYIIDTGKILSEGKLVDFTVQDGDIIWVQLNLKRVTLLGEVQAPGALPLRPGFVMRLSDAIAAKGGIGPNGSQRHVFLGRKQPDGTMKVTEFHLDLFLKNGDLTQNPVLEPGDVIMVGQPKGLTIQGATQALQSFLILETIIRR